MQRDVLTGNFRTNAAGLVAKICAAGTELRVALIAPRGQRDRYVVQRSPLT